MKDQWWKERKNLIKKYKTKRISKEEFCKNWESLRQAIVQEYSIYEVLPNDIAIKYPYGIYKDLYSKECYFVDMLSDNFYIDSNWKFLRRYSSKEKAFDFLKQIENS